MSHRNSSAVLASTLLNSTSFSSSTSLDIPTAVRGGLVSTKVSAPRRIEVYVFESEYPYCALPTNYFERAQGQIDASKGGMVMEISRV